jgi:polyisoprenoid-binding protein YceI
MKPFLCLAALLPLLAAAQTPPAAKLLPAQSEIVFTSRQMGVPVEGRFRRFDALVAFEPRQPETGQVTLTVDLASVAMGAAESEAEVAKPGWFNTKGFPHASFQSGAIKAVGGGRFEMSGKFTLKGQTRDLTVPVTLAQAQPGGTSVASGSFVVRRLDFRIGDGDWADTSLVANDVQVRFKLALSGLPAP